MLMITAKRAEKRKNAIESAIEDVILNRTIFFEKYFFPLFIGVCGQFLSAIENAIEKMFANRIIAFYICSVFFEVTPRKLLAVFDKFTFTASFAYALRTYTRYTHAHTGTFLIKLIKGQ